MKKLILIASIALSVVCLIAVGVTIAWFTDLKETTNVFTAGDVTISVSELNPQGEEVKVGNHFIQMDYGHTYPGRKIVKNTTVTNMGSELAYFAAEIVIIDGEMDLSSVLSIPGTDVGITPINEFFVGGLFGENYTRVENPSAPHFIEWENENYLIQYDTRMTEGFWINIFAKNTLPSGNSLKLWDGFTFPLTWGNDEMLQCSELRISMRYFAVQAAGFNNCEEAIITAFDKDFGLPG